jgi:hypothetical protein
MKDAFIFETAPFGSHSEFSQNSCKRCSSFSPQGSYNQQPLSPFVFESEIYQPAESEDVIQGFTGDEHRDIGDLALGKRPTSIVYDERGSRLTFGEMIALAGDYFETYYEMAELARTRNGRARIAFARWDARSNPKPPAPPVPTEIKKAVVERYHVLASQNISHFSAGGTAWNTYMSFHSKALVSAFEAGEKSDAKIWQRTISKEGFACHFLTDMFSAGHVRTPRLEMRNWYRQNRLDSIDPIVKYMARFIYNNLCKPNNKGDCTTNNLGFWGDNFPGKARDKIGNDIKKLAGAAIKTFSLGDIVSLALHNFDNKGLDVVTELDSSGKSKKGGDRWRALGDGHLKNEPLQGKTRTMAVNAVKASFRELERVREAGKKYTGSKSSGSRADAIKKAMGNPLFAAKGFVPKEDLSSSKNIRLPGTGSGSSGLEWRWGRLGQVAYQQVDKTVKIDIADEILKQLPNVKDPRHREAFKAFVGHVRGYGIRALEAAFGKKAR